MNVFKLGVSILSDTRGNIAMMFALCLVPLLAGAGGAVDYGVWVHQKQELQSIADETALTAARELYVANTSAAQAEAAAQNSAKQPTTFDGALTIKTSANVAEGTVEVVISQPGKSFFSLIAITPPMISVTAVARAFGGSRICVLATDEKASTALDMSMEGQITAPTCAIYSNATSTVGIDVSNKALLTAEFICSAGGAGGDPSAYHPSATTDCPIVADPLAARPAPDVSSCDHNNFKMMNKPNSAAKTLQPGVYCGGLLISGGQVELEPGIYVINGGELWIKSGAQISGENVGFYFAGTSTRFYLESNSIVDLTAPKDGPMAGILFFQDRKAKEGIVYEISSNKASVLLGTIYLPRGELAVSSNAPVADQSAWTAVIVKKLTVSSKSELVLNSGYGSTDIPAPTGINNSGRNIVLAK